MEDYELLDSVVGYSIVEVEKKLKGITQFILTDIDFKNEEHLGMMWICHNTAVLTGRTMKIKINPIKWLFFKHRKIFRPGGFKKLTKISVNDLINACHDDLLINDYPEIYSRIYEAYYADRKE